MNNPRAHHVPGVVVFLTFLAAFVLNLVNYPQWMAYARPDWVLLVLFYWCLSSPERVGVGVGWISGLVLDLLYYALIGQHAVAKAFVALAAVTTYRRVRLYDLWRQCIVVLVIASVDIGITVWIYQFTSDIEVELIYWQSALTTGLLWPAVYTLLNLLENRMGDRR